MHGLRIEHLRGSWALGERFEEVEILGDVRVTTKVTLPEDR